MNQLYIHSVIKIREWDAEKQDEHNRIDRHHKDSKTRRQDAGEKGKIGLSSWFLMITNKIKGVSVIKSEDSLKV